MNLGVELLRVLSTFGIVWFHSGANAEEFAYSGLIVFLVLSMYLGGKHGAADKQTLRRRVERLMIPWFFWCVIYAGLNAFRGKAIIPFEGGVVAGVLVGPSIHLWYVPFIFMCLLALDVAKGHVAQRFLAIGSGALAVLFLLTVPLWRTASEVLISPLPQWMHAAGAVFIGIYLLYMHRLSRAVGLLVLLSIFFSAIYVIPYYGVGTPYLLGLFVVVLAVSKYFERFMVDVGFISECMFGVYFIHIFIILVLFKFDMVRGPLLAVSVFAISLLVVMSFRRMSPSLAKYWS